MPDQDASRRSSNSEPRQKRQRRNLSPTHPDVLARRQRDAEAVRLRRMGMTFDVIARTLGYSDSSAAHQALTRHMATYPREDVEAARQLECDRLDALQAAIWQRCMDSEDKLQTWAMDRALKISDQRARLLGLNRPVRQEISVLTESTVDDAIKALQQSMEQQALTHQVELPALPAYAEVIEVTPE